MLGLENEELVAAVLEDWRTAPVNEKVRSTLGFLEKLTCLPAEVGPEDIKPMRLTGVSDRAIEEALYVSFIFNAIDRLADAFDFEIPTAEQVNRNGRFLYMTGYRIGSIPG